jgi:hypothetical protein
VQSSTFVSALNDYKRNLSEEDLLAGESHDIQLLADSTTKSAYVSPILETSVPNPNGKYIFDYP